jgi:hypothetical protein
MKALSKVLPAVVALLTLAACGSGAGAGAGTGAGAVVGTQPIGTTTVGTFIPAYAVPPGTKTATVTTVGRLQPPPAKYRVHLTVFRSANGDIGCAIRGGVARCDIAERSWKPPARPASCPLAVPFGHGLEIGRSGTAHFVCAGDSVLNPGAARLPAEKTSLEGPFMCGGFMEEIVCQRLPQGTGFLISRKRYQIF